MSHPREGGWLVNKKTDDRERRILGRKLARELTQEELKKAVGTGPKTYTLTYPPDSDRI